MAPASRVTGRSLGTGRMADDETEPDWRPPPRPAWEVRDEPAVVGRGGGGGNFKSARAMGLLGIVMGIAFALIGVFGGGGGGAVTIGVIMGVTGITFYVYGRFGAWRNRE